MQHAASPRQTALRRTLPDIPPAPVHPVSNAVLGWSGVAAIGFASLVYLLARLTRDSFSKTFDTGVGDLTDGSSEWMEDLLARS